jgi:hypothetical protein
VEITPAKAAQNLKPAVKPNQCHRGGTIRQFNQSHYIIGINKLGTLLSSQTTDTPGTTQTNIQDRSGATFQTYRLSKNFANQRFRDPRPSQPPPTSFRRPDEPPVLVLVLGGLAARGNQLFAVSPAATQKTIHARQPHRNPAPAPHQNPANTRQNHPPHPPGNHPPSQILPVGCSTGRTPAVPGVC